MHNPVIKTGQYEGQLLSAVTDKTFLIQYRTKHQDTLKGLDLLAVNSRIRELHKTTR
ncbi:hypothetical protein SAMN05216167_105164 [Spirosoma endophyticum]|uniref:Uncharacterized protein n=1 Tax=Spirosoma endophyticum TaxID=662367 RepID=A0A1I1SSI5_9BACT|nr:hypothetical protein SAMN05216167_105164 [Spirosoma endophyticum]